MLSKTKKTPNEFLKLAGKNVKKSAKDYLIYFFTLMFCVSLFYTFNSIGSQFAMLEIDDSLNFLSFASGMVLLVSVFICMIISGLIVYANRFLLKRRKKEIGIYITLGMEQEDILALLMRETLLIGGISLVSGIIAGVFVSQGLALITAKMIGIGLMQTHFFFSVGAVVKSILFFAVVFGFVHLFNARELRRLQLIDLIYADRKNEVLEIEGNRQKSLIFVASLVLIAGGYAWIIIKISQNPWMAIGSGMALIGVGSVLFFLSVSDMMVRFLNNRKKFYYRGLNMFVLRQIASRMKSNTFSMTAVSILMFASVTTMAVGLGGGKSIIESSNEAAPYDISFTEFAEGFDAEDEEKDLTQISLEKKLKELGLQTDSLFFETAELSIFDRKEVSGSLFLSGDDNGNKYLDRNSGLAVIGVEDYNRAMRLQNKPEITLKDNEFALNYNIEEVRKIYEAYAKKPGSITVNGSVLQMKDAGLYRSSYATNTLLMDNGTVIVPHKVLHQLKPYQKVLNCTFQAGEKEGYAQFMEEMIKLPELPQWEAKEAVTVQIFSDTIIFTYIGIYLGIIFLITAGAVLALQQLSQSADNVKRYQLLRRLGTKEEELQRSVLSQLFLYFGIPAGIAAVHSAIVIGGICGQFSNLTPADVVFSVLFSFTAAAVIYSIYFVTTYIGSFRMLRNTLQ